MLKCIAPLFPERLKKFSKTAPSDLNLKNNQKNFNFLIMEKGNYIKSSNSL